MKVKAFIEKGNDGSYDIWIDTEEKRLSYGLLGQGKSVKESLDDFYVSYKEMKELYEDEGKVFQEVEFEFKYDLASFLAYYSDKLSLAGLERLTGVNQGQLSHYLTGKRKPSEKTVRKIEQSLHTFANELSQVEFV
jgi:hypothetical protein